MITDFSILSGITVPQNYTWDNGIPFATPLNLAQANSSTTYISGYAPGLAITFKNDSTNDLPPENATAYINYSWDFGDYYNDLANKVSLSCIEPIQHTYIMPGRYTVTLTNTQAYSQIVLDPGDQYCRGKYDLNWYWDNLNTGTVDQQQTIKNWNSVNCNATYAKQWDNEQACFEKYCKYWSWEQLKSVYVSKATWEQSQTGSIFEKRWQFEANDTICSVTDTEQNTTVNTTQQITTKKYIVEIKEIPPIAGLYSVTRPPLTNSPTTIRLTSRTSRCGSFPIDRIDWDFGDGSPVKIVTRQGAASDLSLIGNNVYPADTLDPRNYDVVHVYNINANTYPIFYPSLTAYSANTGTYDSCSITIGPIKFGTLDQPVSLLKVKNTLYGNLYTMGYNDACSFLTTASGDGTSFNIKPPATIPPNSLIDSYGAPDLYTGNNGNLYPPQFVPSCGAVVAPEPADLGYIAAEEDPFTIDAITQEDNSYILI